MFNLDDFSEFVFIKPTWGRLKRRSPRPEDDQIPGEWHILTELLSPKGTTLEEAEEGKVAQVKTLCGRYFFRGGVEGVIERPIEGYWCQQCIVEGVRKKHPAAMT